MDKIQRFTIHLKPISWNVLVRKNHWTVTKVFNDWHEQTIAGLLIARIRPCRTFPVTVHYHAKWKQKRRHDIDSLMIKPVQDTLTEAGIWPDDSLPYVSSVTFTGELGAAQDGLEVTIADNRIE